MSPLLQISKKGHIKVKWPLKYASLTTQAVWDSNLDHLALEPKVLTSTRLSLAQEYSACVCVAGQGEEVGGG